MHKSHLYRQFTAFMLITSPLLLAVAACLLGYFMPLFAQVLGLGGIGVTFYLLHEWYLDTHPTFLPSTAERTPLALLIGAVALAFAVGAFWAALGHALWFHGIADLAIVLALSALLYMHSYLKHGSFRYRNQSPGFYPESR